MRLSGDFQIFFKKNFLRTPQAKTNEKNKIKRIKNNRGNNFSQAKTSKRVEIVCFCLWRIQKIFLKKILKLS